MSEVIARKLLENRLDALPAAAAIATARENVDFVPPAPDVPYQRVDLLMNTPDNPVIGSGYQMLGVLQVSLFFPRNGGSGGAVARAGQIRDWFPRGLSLTESAFTVTIERTPEIGSGLPDEDRYMVPVRIRWFASQFH